jgi:peptidoglycan/xylan/chitin deacetylase (PgdA/CDA1 family)
VSASRKILCIFALGATAIAALGASAAGAGAPLRTGRRNAGAPQPDLLRAGLSQAGERLIATIRTARPMPLDRLDPLPSTRSAGSSYLCLELQRKLGGGRRRLCLGGEKANRRVGLELVNGRGDTIGQKTLAARVKRPDRGKLVVSLIPSMAGLSPRHYFWRALESRGDCGGRPRTEGKLVSNCEESLPARGERRFRLRPVRVVGCTGAAPELDTNGPRERRVVALTFDDGPSEYTPAFLDVLREKHVEGTFFEIGQEMPGREDIMRRILREGSEIGNHTMHHAELPGYSELAEDSALVESSTHFRPCLFRPPGGAVDPAVISTAAELGMRTITWDVDPADWTNPGGGAVYSRVVEATGPGSIVLMHDGGGDRSGTLAALPEIIDTLRARGYRFATVSRLLGERLVYRPYG